MQEFYDAIIVGAGPAGLSAAIYLARAQYKVLVLEKDNVGGQITITSEVVNYPGVLKTDGKSLTETMRKQAEYFGAEFLKADVNDFNFNGDFKEVHTDKGIYYAIGVVLATGANPRKIGFPGELEFQGRGIAYCATCDGEFFTGADVFVIGGGFAAAEEAVFLTRYAKKVTIIVREDDFTCAKSVALEALNHPNIKVYFHTEVQKAGGVNQLEYAVFKDNHTGETWEYRPAEGKSFGMFVFAGYAPATSLFKGKLELDPQGYLVTDMNKKTSTDGVYGAGDVCVKNLRQVVTAVSDGAVAATSLEKYIADIYEKKSLSKQAPKVRPVATAPKATDSAGTRSDGKFITNTMGEQLAPVFEKMEQPILLKAYLDDTPLSYEVEEFLKEIDSLTNKVKFITIKDSEDEILYPSIQICDSDGLYKGAAFHGVPGGHEINSFIIALYNAAGPGQAVDEEILNRIGAIDKKIDIKIMVSLSCTMCPELVMAAQRIALENKNITAEVYDLAHYKSLKDKYNIMSVPCFVINDDLVLFGKKSISEILDILEEKV